MEIRCISIPCHVLQNLAQNCFGDFNDLHTINKEEARTHFFHIFFPKIFFEGHQSFFEATDTPILDFWWRLPRVSKSQGGSPYLHASLPGFLRLTSGATSADLLAASMTEFLNLWTRSKRIKYVQDKNSRDMEFNKLDFLKQTHMNVLTFLQVI